MTESARRVAETGASPRRHGVLRPLSIQAHSESSDRWVCDTGTITNSSSGGTTVSDSDDNDPNRVKEKTKYNGGGSLARCGSETRPGRDGGRPPVNWTEYRVDGSVVFSFAMGISE